MNLVSADIIEFYEDETITADLPLNDFIRYAVPSEYYNIDEQGNVNIKRNLLIMVTITEA